MPIANYRVSIAALLSFAAAAFAQESPTPTATPSPSPMPTATPTPARSVRISFLPPPLEGRISLGIYDARGKLVRVLHREAEVDEFTVGADALVTKWDGKNDQGEDLPRGKYRAHGFLVGRLNVEHLGTANTPPTDDPTTVQVKLIANPLEGDTRKTIDVAVGLDTNSSFIKTSDGLPLTSISVNPGDAPQAFNTTVKRVLMTKSGDSAVDVWEDSGDSVDQAHISNIQQMMAFDCGEIELK